ncbi:Bug family tripartite tricarboxylate transporter substrate binding protein [Bordetella genomosp. 13]|uniref:LacI family transcriptional regulator n=1 Tax=Bordetella genomosp. 13 TaxID=463040 RepID=A0A1W6ZAY9_9BORD|nr:tripartite tricarboxylate transporter substrate binding protein [Bordetella genomosp. 13]ARP94553.1 LacI family transcriptional regulator [Bordetella genomosp. 13]
MLDKYLPNRLMRAGALPALLLIAAFASQAAAQPAAFPAPGRPIHLVSPSPPGGGTDTTARLLAAKVSQSTGWQFVIENRPGAGNMIGLVYGARAAPDGHTIVLGETSNLVSAKYLYSKLQIDPETDVAPVALVGTGTLALVVSTSKPYQSIADVVAAARQSELTYATSGNGTVGHLVSASWARQSGAKLVHVPYKGAGPAMTDLLGGQVDIYFSSLSAAAPLIKSGKLRALAVTSAQRNADFPQVPTLAEAGFPGLDYYVFYGVVAPAGTPPETIGTLNREINRTLATPEMKKELADKGVEVRITGTPAEFDAFLAAERAKWRKVIQETGVTID